MTQARKQLSILVVVVGSALIGGRVYSLAVDDEASAAPIASKRQGRSAVADSVNIGAPESAPDLQLDRLDARQMALSESVDPWPRSVQLTPFDSVNWQPPALKSAPLAPTPKPVAPPFSYAYMGGMTEDGVRTAFFTRGDRMIVLKVGDTVDATYRVDQMTDKTMKLTYLPLEETLELALGSGR